MSLWSTCRRGLYSVVTLPHRLRNDSKADYMRLPNGSSGSPGADHATPAGAWTWLRGRRRRLIVCAGLAIVAFLALALGLGLGLGLPEKTPEEDDNWDGPVVNLNYANYTGTYLPNGISEYLGMRYARPPTGDLRWRAPVEPEPEARPQKAKEFGPICLATGEGKKDTTDEDCLFVNVWGPTNVTAEAKLPVQVFIQGGGYTRNANYNWNGSQLVETSENNIVFVNFNYRVGLWGFLAGEEVQKDGDLNAGLLDQRHLLKWVQEHISKFGGDPEHVVIHGISAGAGSVALHLVAYGGRNDHLFVGAISESIFIPAHPHVHELEYQLDRVMVEAGCANEELRMDCLRSKGMEDLQALNAPSPFPDRAFNPLFYWSPCIDGDFLQDIPSVLYQKKKFLSVPSLFGTCTNEGSIFPPKETSSTEDFISFFQDNYPTLQRVEAEFIVDRYPQEPRLPQHDSWFPSASRAYGESTFICPTNNILDDFSNHTTGALWSYRYNVHDFELDAKGLGVNHVAEAPAIFGPDMLSHKAQESYKSYNAEAIPLVRNYILSFVRTLNPNEHKFEGAPDWKPWGKDRSRIVLQTYGSSMENVAEPEVERCAFWKGLSRSMNQ